MSYILDALKKSEREKTLGQVPTLESVISDGAKKQRTGTPWWLNVIVFFVTLIAVTGILKMAGLIDLTGLEKAVSQQAGQSEEMVSDTTTSVTAVEPADAGTSTGTSAALSTQIDLIPELAIEPQTSSVDTGQAETVPLQDEMENSQLAEVRQNPQALQTLPEDSSASNPQDTTQNTGGQQIEEQSAQETAQEIAELAEQIEAQQIEAQLLEDQAASNLALATQAPATPVQQLQPQYEEVIHDSLRNISVNVVSFSSDARQRFVMLDLTIYKEGDELPNNAQIVEIIRTGAIVEYQNKRYLLKP